MKSFKETLPRSFGSASAGASSGSFDAPAMTKNKEKKYITCTGREGESGRAWED